VARPQLTRSEAASERALKYRDQTARPTDRSAPEQSGAPRLWTPAVHARCSVERAAVGSAHPDTARFEGFASVTGQTYPMWDGYGEYREEVEVGAFAQTLAQSDLDVPLVLDHVSSRRIARTGNASSPLELAEITDGDTTGLQTIAPTLQLSDPDVAYIVPKLASMLIDEMSFRFSIEAGRWNDEFTQYTIQRVNIHRGDVSIVGYGANPHTTGSGLRSAPEVDPVARALALARSEAGDGKYARLAR
jgi:HK97 family phage prohead protease